LAADYHLLRYPFILSKASWHIIEKPTLRLKGPTGKLLRGIMDKIGLGRKKVV